MKCRYLAMQAARSAVFQRRHGDTRSLRELYARAYSLLRYFHHNWGAVLAA